MRVLLIDNYDSFTYNLFHYIGELGAEVVVHRNDALGVDDVMSLGAEGIVISPGPCDPDRAGICIELVKKAAGSIPLFGVCLGHQIIGQVFGGKIIRAKNLMHGKMSKIYFKKIGIFKNFKSPFNATRYHSLIVDKKTLPNCLTITAETQDKTIMGIMHNQYDIYGVQFHPESINTKVGMKLIKNFINR